MIAEKIANLPAHRPDKSRLGETYSRKDAAEELSQFAEIRLRACVKIGELSRELEKVETIGAGKVGIPSDGKPKAERLAEVGHLN
jgi:hypothetical protein